MSNNEPSKPCWETLSPKAGKSGKTEGPQAYQAFRVYCGMGAERSLRAVAQRLGKNVSLIERWSAAFYWCERVRAWDDHGYAVELAVAEEYAREKQLLWLRSSRGSAVLQGENGGSPAPLDGRARTVRLRKRLGAAKPAIHVKRQRRSTQLPPAPDAKASR